VASKDDVILIFGTLESSTKWFVWKCAELRIPSFIEINRPETGENPTVVDWMIRRKCDVEETVKATVLRPDKAYVTYHNF
jgi:hypothetical protein